jgi:hypothetical protein
MASQQPTIEELQALIIQLQQQVNKLTATAPVATAAPAIGAAPAVFADTPQTLGANDLIDYSTKRGSALFVQGCKALDNKVHTNGFAMTPNQTVIFVKAFHRHTTTMG